MSFYGRDAVSDDCMTRIEQDILHVLLKSIFEQGLIPESTYHYVQNQIRTSDLGGKWTEKPL